ncbi:MAG: CoA-binding protein [Melioribacteraceae bacterium]
MDDITICEILETSKTIAIIGLSSNPSKTSRRIADYLVTNGYTVLGVNPNKEFTDAEGIKVFNSLEEITVPIDIIDVFRRSEDIPSIIEEVLKANPKVLWLQLGIRNDEIIKQVIEKGIITIQDKCIKIEHGYCA